MKLYHRLCYLQNVIQEFNFYYFTNRYCSPIDFHFLVCFWKILFQNCELSACFSNQLKLKLVFQVRIIETQLNYFQIDYKYQVHSH